MPPVPKMSKRKRERLARQAAKRAGLTGVQTGRTYTETPNFEEQPKTLRSSCEQPNETNISEADPADPLLPNTPPPEKKADLWVPPNVRPTPTTYVRPERPPICTKEEYELIGYQLQDLLGHVTLRQIYAAVSHMLEVENERA